MRMPTLIGGWSDAGAALARFSVPGATPPAAAAAANPSPSIPRPLRPSAIRSTFTHSPLLCPWRASKER